MTDLSWVLDGVRYEHAGDDCPCRLGAPRPEPVHFAASEEGQQIVLKELSTADALRARRDRLQALATHAPGACVAPMLAWTLEPAPVAAWRRWPMSLAEWLGGRHLREDQLQICATLARCVAALQDAKLGVHGDLTPSNVLYDRPTRLALTDLGEPGPGTAPYAPWEQRLRPDDPGPGWDRYALGMICFEVLTGAHANAASAAHDARERARGAATAWTPASAQERDDRVLRSALLPIAAPPPGYVDSLGLLTAQLGLLLHLEPVVRLEVDLERFAQVCERMRALLLAPDPAPAETPAPPVAAPWRALGLAGIAALLAALIVGTAGAPVAPAVPMVRQDAVSDASLGVLSTDPEPGQTAQDADESAATVALAAYEIGVYEVSQSLWTAVMGTNPARTASDEGGERCAEWDHLPLVGDALPIHCVTFYEALAFANALSRSHGLEPPYTTDDGEIYTPAHARRAVHALWRRAANGYRLPTGPEWEWAARAARQHSLLPGPAGSDGRETLCAYANVGDAALAARQPQSRQTRYACDDGVIALGPVDGHEKNLQGLYEVAGNVREWVWGTVPDATPLDGQGALVETRGGDWQSGADGRDRLANRSWRRPTDRARTVGVRLARGAALPTP